jgi:tRNA A37 N6-isopentenylltransferase MiaA
MIGILDQPDVRYTVAQFRDASLGIAKNLLKEGKMPLLVGGSVPYIESIMFNQQSEDNKENGPENGM